jgi:hypothetical protein
MPMHLNHTLRATLPAVEHKALTVLQGLSALVGHVGEMMLPVFACHKYHRVCGE